jgi:lipoprotein-releasing system permease protein
VDPASRGAVGGFQEHLLNPHNRRHPSFDLPPEMKKRFEGVELWRQSLVWQQYQLAMKTFEEELKHGNMDAQPPVAPAVSEIKLPRGIILGNNIASFRQKDANEAVATKDVYLLRPGDHVHLVTYKGGEELRPADSSYLVCDYFKSEMSEYDSNYVFLPLDEVQRLRDLPGHVTSIQMKLKNYGDARQVVKALRRLFPARDFRVETWEDKQGPLLAAISVEKGILNVLLFLIIGVGGFGILAIFAMIVAEKTRDIGILKALGASNGGVMKIFLGYGLLLGLVGAGLGTALGVTLTANINNIEHFLGQLTGRDLFPRDIYYFDKIPTNINVWAVVLVNVGAVAIAVLFSVLPALRAALLHPVRALRYE